MRHAGIESKPVAAMREAAEIIRGVLAGEAVDSTARSSRRTSRRSGTTPTRRAGTCRSTSPATGPMMLRAAAQAADGLLTASITTPAFVRYVRGELEAAGRDPDSLDLGCTIVASIDEDRDRGRDGAREIAGMYLANKVQNIQGAADTLLECAGLTQDEIRPVAEAMEPAGGSRRRRGDRRDPRQVQADRRHARGLHRRDPGVPRRGLHPRDARALGRRPPRAAEAVR